MAKKRSEFAQYCNNPENEIYPISQLDTQILDTFEEVLSIVDTTGLLTSVFSRYKRGSDKRVLTELQALLESKDILLEELGRTDNDDDEKQDREEPREKKDGRFKERTPDYVFEFDGVLIRPKYFAYCYKTEEYDNKQKKIVYKIRFNHVDRSAATAVAIAPLCLSYYNKQAQTNAMERLKKKLIECGIVITTV